LAPLQDGSIQLKGNDWESEYDGMGATKWRKQIRYVTQSKVQIPGTPRQFINKVQSFQSWKEDRSGKSSYDMMKRTSFYIRQWGLNIECLDQEWTVLSGGEAQRVLIGLALASHARILLFDESTSALDNDSKLAVEASINEYVEKHEASVLWVTHDEQQAERMTRMGLTSD